VAEAAWSCRMATMSMAPERVDLFLAKAKSDIAPKKDLAMMIEASGIEGESSYKSIFR
jgi:hypothetical protein